MKHNPENKECDYGKVIEGFHTDDCTCPKDTREEWEEEFDSTFRTKEKLSYPNYGLIKSFITTKIEEAREEAKAIRAKELGELRAKIVRASNHEQIKSGDADPWGVTHEYLFILDELIEKPE